MGSAGGAPRALLAWGCSQGASCEPQDGIVYPRGRRAGLAGDEGDRLCGCSLGTLWGHCTLGGYSLLSEEQHAGWRSAGGPRPRTPPLGGLPRVTCVWSRVPRRWLRAGPRNGIAPRLLQHHVPPASCSSSIMLLQHHVPPASCSSSIMLRAVHAASLLERGLAYRPLEYTTLVNAGPARVRCALVDTDPPWTRPGSVAEA